MIASDMVLEHAQKYVLS